MKRTKSAVSILLAFLMLLSCAGTVMPAFALGEDDKLTSVDAAVETLRGGKCPPKQMYSSEGDQNTYTAEAICWYDTEGNELSDDFVFTLDNDYCLLYSATATGYHYFDINDLPESYVNGIRAVPLGDKDAGLPAWLNTEGYEGNDRTQYYLVTLTAFDDGVIDMFKVTIDAREGYTGMDYDKLITLSGAPTQLSDKMQLNGVIIKNLSNPDDTSGVMKVGDTYSIEFDVEASEGYRFSPYGTVVTEGCIYISAQWSLNTEDPENVYVYIACEAWSEVNDSEEGEADLITGKTVDFADGTAAVTLSAFCEKMNARVKYSSEPVDIVLLIDTSRSMILYNMANNKTRLQVLKDTATGFIDNVSERAGTSGANHRMAIVTFSSSAKRMTGSSNSTAFVDARSESSSLKSIINNLRGDGGTRADYGFDTVQSILAANNDGRKKVVVFLTDGVPTTSSEFNESVANSAIAIANNLKNTYLADIYAVGISVDANPRAQIVENPRAEEDKMNMFMHFVSSNYPQATQMRSGGEQKSDGYFITTEDEERLSEIFSGIISEQLSGVIRFEDLTFCDKISKYFTLTAEQEAALRGDLVERYGLTNDDIIITRNSDGTTDIEIHHLSPKRVYENGMHTGYEIKVNFNVTGNENMMNPGSYPVTVAPEGKVKTSDGQTAAYFETPDAVTVSGSRAIVKYIIGETVYKIKDTAIGEAVTAPDTETILWDIEENQTVTSAVTTVTGHFTGDTHTVTLHIGDDTDISEYYEGQIIVVPEVGEIEGYLFAGWDILIPAVMGKEDVEATAALIPHTHSFEVTSITGDCESGMTTVETCAGCGKTKTSFTEPSTHQYTAHITSDSGEHSKASIVCTKCGKVYQEETTINYKAASSIFTGVSRMIDITMTEDDVSIQPDGTITVKVALDPSLANKLFIYVYRINEDGSKTRVDCEKKDGMLYLYLDHFSLYLLCDEESTDNLPGYEEVAQAVSNYREVIINGAPESGEMKLDYGKTAVFTCKADGMQKNEKIVWDVQGKVESFSVSPDGMTCTVQKGTGDYTVTCSLLDEYDAVISRTSEKITVNRGFFIILKWFFIHLFKPDALIWEQK
ncbi:MAG: VWA domain-containing protein [Clostridiales bacterium]|nr:VWA domain-containing protein [Clostridiales bacterium]